MTRGLRCYLCGRRLPKAELERRCCADVPACSQRTLSTMAGKPYVGGFDPDAAYQAAPKLGVGKP